MHSPRKKLLHAHSSHEEFENAKQINLQLDKSFPKKSEFVSIPEDESVKSIARPDSEEFGFSHEEFRKFMISF
jgi:hypothetical protein